MTDRTATLPTDNPVGRVNGAHPVGFDWDGIRDATDRALHPVGRHALIAAPADTSSTDRFTDRSVGLSVSPGPTGSPTDQPTDSPRPTGQLRAVGTLGLVNGLAIYGQLAYVYDHVAPASWNQPSRIALSVGAAAAVESIALFVGWHAHDALLRKAPGTARALRRRSYLIAAVVAAANYAHFAQAGLRPTAAAVMFGLVSLLSPWLWGLHTRRQQHMQLVKERRADEVAVEFATDKWRSFPIRTFMARRWSIDHGVTDPGEAWRGYNAERLARRADRFTNGPTDNSVGVVVDRSTDSGTDRHTDRFTDNSVGQVVGPGPTDRPTGSPTDRPTTLSVSPAYADRQIRRQVHRPTRTCRRRPVADNSVGPGPTDSPTDLSVPESTTLSVDAVIPAPVSSPPATPTTPRLRRAAPGKHSAAAVANAAVLRGTYPKRLTDTDGQIRKATGWSYDRLTAAKAAYLDKADLKAAKEDQS